MPELHTTKPEPKRHDFAAGETGRGPSVPSNGLANDPKAGQYLEYGKSHRKAVPQNR